MAKYFQAEMKTVYLLGRDKPSVLVCLYIMNYKEESIVSSNIGEAKLLQKSEMRKDIVIELSYRGFSRISDYS